jgi:hypothetical protein
MRPRTFIAGLGSAAVWPIAAQAMQPGDAPGRMAQEKAAKTRVLEAKPESDDIGDMRYDDEVRR